jgi:DHA1 family multidrug resistance protein-like MFS transporter
LAFASPSRFGYIFPLMELWRKNLYILWGTQFLAMIGMNLVVPFLPFYIRQLGITEPDELARWSGLVFSGPFFLSVVFTPFWGMMGDRYGRKKMVVRALFGLALSQALIGFSQNVWQLLMFRLLQGVISGFIASALAFVSTSTPRNRIGYALGLLQSATAAGTVLGPAVGGVLADLIGYREIFFVTAAFCTVGGFVVVFGVQEVTMTNPEAKQYSVIDNVRLMFSDKRLRLVGALFVIGQMSVLMVEPLFALFIEGFRTDTRYLSTVTGGIVSIAGLFMVVSAPWWGKRNDRSGYRKNLSIAMGVVGLCYVGHILVQDLVQLSLLRALLGFMRGGVLPALYSLTNHFSPPERRSGMIAIASSLTILGNMLGPVMGGAIAGRFGLTGAFIANSAILLVLSLVVWKKLDEHSPSHEPAIGSAGAGEQQA